MANPLQPKCIKVLENEFDAYVINLVSSSRSGDPDLIACIEGDFWGFEVKWKSDKPSELQKKKINFVIDAGGKAYFIRSIGQLRNIILTKQKPIRYETKEKFIL